MQGKFWAESSSSSSYDSSDNENISSSFESESEAPVQCKKSREVNKWNLDSDSDSSDDGQRVVKGAKDKFYDELHELIKKITTSMKISDFGSLNDDYEKLLKSIQKHKHVLNQGVFPRFLLGAFVDIETYIDEKFKDKDGLKKLSKARATSFNTLRAKYRKSIEEYKDIISQYKINPLSFPDDSESEESYSDNDRALSSDSDLGSSSDLDSDDNSSDSSLSSLSSSSSGISDNELMYEDRHASALAKWGTREKKTKIGAKDKKKVTKTVKKLDETISQTNMNVNNSIESFLMDDNITVDVLLIKVGEIVSARGKKGTDRQEQIRLLKRAAELAKPLSLQVYADVLTHLISAQFDTISGAFHCISSTVWAEISSNINILLNLILNNDSEKGIHISGFQSFIFSKDKKGKLSNETIVNGSLTNVDDDEEEEEINHKEQDKSTVSYLISFVERLDGELLKALQLTDVHSIEYKGRLVQSLYLLALLWRTYDLCQRRNYCELLATISGHLINQLHFKDDILSIKVWEYVDKILIETCDNYKDISQLYKELKPSELIHKLICNVYKIADTKIKLKALLQQIYNLALNDNYNEALDLFQTMNIYDMALNNDVTIQILYNRSFVQLGLSAFRLGNIIDSQLLLNEICTPIRNRELLAQGMSNIKSQDKTPEQERLEKRRLLPYHMHLSLEIIDCIYLISSMLIEVPYVAYHKTLVRSGEVLNIHKVKPISKQFRRLLEQHEKQTITGPPESLRDTIVAATKCLQLGKWKECFNYIKFLHIWKNMNNSDDILIRLEENIKKEALKTYLFTYSHLYDSFSVKNLSNMYELDVSVIYSLLSKMILKSEISALWDQSGEFIILNHKSTSKLHMKSISLADKLLQFSDLNEQIISTKNSKINLNQNIKNSSINAHNRKQVSKYRNASGSRNTKV